MDKQDYFCISFIFSIISLSVTICLIGWYVYDYKCIVKGMESGYNQVLNVGTSGYHWEKSKMEVK